MKKLWFKIKLLFGKSKKIISSAIEPSIKVVNILKDVVENPLLNIVVRLTPFSWDDYAFSVAKRTLPKALIELEIIKGLQGKSNEEIFSSVISEIRKFTPDAKANFYEDLAVMLSHFLSDGKLSCEELTELVKYIYENKYQNK